MTNPKAAQGWVPVALSQDIPPGTSAGAAVDAAEIVVWRDRAGAAHAWEDRCPHRGMKLSFGFVRGDHIACLYHGWEYDGTGTCRHVPAHPELEVPKSICIARYQAAEAAGMIWAHVPLGSEAVGQPVADAGEGLRSVYVAAPLPQTLAGLAALAPDCRVDDPVATATLGDCPLRIGLQPIGPAASALHVTLPADIPVARRLELLDRLEHLRRSVEAGMAEVPA